MSSTPKTTCFFCLFFALFFYSSCRKDFKESNTLSGGNNKTATINALQFEKPNIIMILADDIGYEVPTYTGGQSYSTPNIDMLATRGMQFSHCYATPNCCPSRTELLSGKYGVRNYIDWGSYDLSQRTFVNYFKDAGYATCVAGKWQLGSGDIGAKALGFDNYLLYDPFTAPDDNGGTTRYKNPQLYQDSNYLPKSQTDGKYADDMFVDYINKFIDSNKEKPFFIYYSLSLCHLPFCPTPDDPEYAAWDPMKNPSNKKYFPSMVKYMDKKIGQVISKIDSVGLSNNTIIVFSGDNGTPPNIVSQYQGRNITGGKNKSTDFGTHVPLIVSCPAKIPAGTIQPTIVDYSDFFRTFTDMANIPSNTLTTAGFLDSKSFYPYLISNIPDSVRTWSYCYWKPNSLNPGQNKHFVQDLTYKLYDSTNFNKFFNMAIDSFEVKPLKTNQLTSQEKQIRQNFQSIIASIHK